MHPRTLSRTAALLLASSLVLAACGGGQTDAERAATGATLATTAPETTSAPEATADPIEPTIVDDEPSSTTTESAAEAPASEPVAHLFPDVDVLDIYNGGEVNLAEVLPGGDKAVLLWFFAPH